MLSYRFYFLDPLDHILAVEDRRLKSDNAALAAARRLSKEHPIEVWQEDRQVGRADVARPNARTTDNGLFC